MNTFIFDFDDTILNMRQVKEDIYTKMSALGVPGDIARQSYEESKFNGGLYTLENHAKTIIEKYSIDFDKDELINWFKNLDFKSYVFDKSNEVLEYLKKDNKLILLTKGDETFQKIKIDGSDILKYFHEMHIVPYDKEIFLKDHKFSGPVYFINDKINENEKIRELFPDLNILHSHHGFDIEHLLKDFLSLFK